MRVVSKLTSKKALAAASVTFSTLLFASSAYAINTTFIQTDSNDIDENVALSDSSTGTQNDGSVEETVLESSFEIATQQPNQAGNKDITTDPTPPTPPRQPNVPTPPSTAVPTQSVGNGASDDESPVIIHEGSESSNDSNVRVRIRNSSERSLNGDDQSGGGSFSLQINESTSAE